jgi:hypothetical protein
MGSNVAQLFDPAAAPEQEEPRLDGVTLVALAFRESTLDGRTYLEAYGIDSGGTIVVLAPRRAGHGSAAERTALFSSLLARGLRAPGPVLVDAAGCARLRNRIAAAWGPRAVLLPSVKH